MGAGPYGCSYVPVFLNLIRLANPLLKYANVCGPPDLRAVAQRLRTTELDEKKLCKRPALHFEQTADSNTVSTYQVDNALKRPDRLKQCHCLQFAQKTLLLLNVAVVKLCRGETRRL